MSEDKAENTGQGAPSLVPREVGRATMIEGLPAVKLPLANQPAPPPSDAPDLSSGLKIPLANAVLGEESSPTIPVTNRVGRGTMVEGLPALKVPESTSGRVTMKLDVASKAPETSEPEGLASPETDASPETSDEPEHVRPAAPQAKHQKRTFKTEPLAPVSSPTSKAGTIVATAAITTLACGLLFGAMTLLVSPNGSKGEVATVAPKADYRVQVTAGPFTKGLSNDFRLMFSKSCKGIAEDPKVECEEKTALAGEIPIETVDEASFAIDAHEVSNQAYTRCVEAGKCTAPDLEACENRTLQGYLPFLRVPKGLFAPTKPVVCVNQNEAQTYCEWASATLPTSNQWEKAARGPDGYLFPWGSDWDGTLANWGERDMLRGSVAGKLDGYLDSAPVGSYPEGASKYGALDMAGNVSEWTHGVDETGQAEARGGSWISNPIELRATIRLKLKPETRRTDVGFRCAAPQ